MGMCEMYSEKKKLFSQKLLPKSDYRSQEILTFSRFWVEDKALLG